MDASRNSPATGDGDDRLPVPITRMVIMTGHCPKNLRPKPRTHSARVWKNSAEEPDQDPMEEIATDANDPDQEVCPEEAQALLGEMLAAAEEFNEVLATAGFANWQCQGRR